MTFTRFEDINVWQKARAITKEIYQITGKQDFAKDYGLKDQLRRSTVSIMANIAEGHGRRSDKEFANFLNFSMGSIAETKSHLYISFDLKYISENEFTGLYEKTDELARMTFGLIKHLRGKSFKKIEQQH